MAGIAGNVSTLQVRDSLKISKEAENLNPSSVATFESAAANPNTKKEVLETDIDFEDINLEEENDDNIFQYAMISDSDRDALNIEEEKIQQYIDSTLKKMQSFQLTASTLTKPSSSVETSKDIVPTNVLKIQFALISKFDFILVNIKTVLSGLEEKTNTGTSTQHFTLEQHKKYSQTLVKYVQFLSSLYLTVSTAADSFQNFSSSILLQSSTPSVSVSLAECKQFIYALYAATTLLLNIGCAVQVLGYSTDKSAVEIVNEIVMKYPMSMVHSFCAVDVDTIDTFENAVSHFTKTVDQELKIRQIAAASGASSSSTATIVKFEAFNEMLKSMDKWDFMANALRKFVAKAREICLCSSNDK